MEPDGSPGLRDGASRRLRVSAALVHLEAVRGAVADDDAVFVVDRDTDRALERSLERLDRGGVLLAQLHHLGVDRDVGRAHLPNLALPYRVFMWSPSAS